MRAILFLVYLFVEIALLVGFGDEFGIFTLFLEIVLSAIFGFIAIFSIRESFIGYISNIPNLFNLGNFVGSAFCRLSGGILLILPGILSDIFGCILLILSLVFVFKGQDSANFKGDFRDNFSQDSRNWRDFRQDSRRDFGKDSSDDEVIDVEIIEKKPPLDKK